MSLYDYAASGNCYKVRLLLGLLGRPYERVPIDIFGGDTLSEEYGRLNPARETPALELDDGTVITQSNAILWYLAEGTELLPATAVARAQVAQWLFFEQERVMGIGGTRFRKITARNPELVASRHALGQTALEILDDHISRQDWLVGDSCTIADGSVFAYTPVAEEAGVFAGGLSGGRSLARPRPRASGFRRRPRAVPRERAPGPQSLDLRSLIGPRGRVTE
jgi:glutathione S-transferase